MKGLIERFYCLGATEVYADKIMVACYSAIEPEIRQLTNERDVIQKKANLSPSPIEILILNVYRSHCLGWYVTNQ